MSTPSWIRRFSDTDGTLSGPDSGLTNTASLYSGSQGSRSNLYQSRSRENLAPENNRKYRRNVPSSGNLSETDTSGRVRSSSRFSNDQSSSRYGNINSGYLSDAGSSKYRSGNESGGEELEMSPRYKTMQNRKKQKYEQRTTPRTVDRLARRDGRGDPKREESWSYVDSRGYSEASPSLHTSASYDDFDGATSSASESVFNNSRLRNVHSSSNLEQHHQDDRRKRTRRKDDSSNETCTSGYSTNSLSEMSEYTNRHHSRDGGGGGGKNGRYSGETRRPSATDFDKSPVSSTSGSRSQVPHKCPSDDKLSSSTHRRSDSRLSVNDSDISMSSKDKAKKAPDKDKRRSSASIDSKVHLESKTQNTKVPTIGNVAITVTNNIQYDPNDPFSFIQPVELPFHKKLRKCLGPIMAVLLLIILAGALGAAIYFASELKETQEKQIEMLEANLALKIRNTGYNQNIDELSARDFKLLATTYCKQMDVFYSRSKFHSTYRGCEVLSFKNKQVNFTLFFEENEATSNQIIGVIESSATKVQDESHSLAIVDRFEVELDTATVTMEKKVKSESFNKKITAPKSVNVIEILSANIILRIRDHDYAEDMSSLSSHEFQYLSSSFCRKMDSMYSTSKYTDDYRGCEVIAFRTNSINFTLYFVESTSSTQDIVNVIETSASQVTRPDGARIVKVDKFDLDIDGAKVTLGTKLEQEGFYKTVPSPKPTTTKAPRLKDITTAKVVLNVRSEGYPQDLDRLSAKGFKELSTIFCKQMDEYFHRSQYQKSYRGCEVRSFNDRKIDFRVYFLDRQELSSAQVKEVINLYVERTGSDVDSPVKIGKFVVELNTAVIAVEKQKKREGFDLRLGPEEEAPAKPVKAAEPTVDVKDTKGRKTPPNDKPVYSWKPCEEYIGSYFPHPVNCNKFFQCSNGVSIDRDCDKGTLYQWKTLSCVSRYTPNVQCPDPKKAPPRPKTTTTTIATTPSTVAKTTSTVSLIDMVLMDELNTDKTLPTTGATKKPATTFRFALPPNMKLTQIAGRAKGRPVYPADPCQTGVDGNLYPHPDDCGKFIQCVNGKGESMDCAPNLVFDPVDDTCIPKNPELVCPDLRPCAGKNDGYFSHPINCSKFIQCRFGKETAMACKGDLVWNAKVNSCTLWTSSIKCPDLR